MNKPTLHLAGWS